VEWQSANNISAERKIYTISFERIAKNEYDAVNAHHLKFSTLTCRNLLNGRSLWARYKETLHLIKNILMPAFKDVLNEAGTNLVDALDHTRWAHWAFKTNVNATKIAKAAAKKKEDRSLSLPDGSVSVPNRTFYSWLIKKEKIALLRSPVCLPSDLCSLHTHQIWEDCWLQ
jgi:hypothetical protein